MADSGLEEVVAMAQSPSTPRNATSECVPLLEQGPWVPIAWRGGRIGLRRAPAAPGAPALQRPACARSVRAGARPPPHVIATTPHPARTHSDRMVELQQRVELLESQLAQAFQTQGELLQATSSMAQAHEVTAAAYARGNVARAQAEAKVRELAELHAAGDRPKKADRMEQVPLLQEHLLGAERQIQQLLQAHSQVVQAYAKGNLARDKARAEVRELTQQLAALRGAGGPASTADGSE